MLFTAKPDTRSIYFSPDGPYKYIPSAEAISVKRGLLDVCAVFNKNSCRLLSIDYCLLLLLSSSLKSLFLKSRSASKKLVAFASETTLLNFSKYFFLQAKMSASKLNEFILRAREGR